MQANVLERVARFNPRSRAGSDIIERLYAPTLKVSIHAPARGATLIKTELYNTVYVSIHAPARGATEGGFAYTCQLRFNPRSRAGSDRRNAQSIRF